MSCKHPVTVDKFDGSMVCTRCSMVVGTWKDPQPKINVTFVPEED